MNGFDRTDIVALSDRLRDMAVVVYDVDPQLNTTLTTAAAALEVMAGDLDQCHRIFAGIRERISALYADEGEKP